MIKSILGKKTYKEGNKLGYFIDNTLQQNVYIIFGRKPNEYADEELLMLTLSPEESIDQYFAPLPCIYIKKTKYED